MVDLQGLLDDVWHQVVVAVDDQAHGFHYPVIATVDAEGNPHTRVVVLRSATATPHQVTFNTDFRSPKRAQVDGHPRIAMNFHDNVRKLQIRVLCEANVERQGELPDSSWAQIGLGSKRCYLAPHPPSSDAGDQVSHNLPEGMNRKMPTPEQAEAGRTNFCVIRCLIDQLDIMELGRTGHARAQYRFHQGELTSATWVNP